MPLGLAISLPPSWRVQSPFELLIVHFVLTLAGTFALVGLESYVLRRKRQSGEVVRSESCPHCRYCLEGLPDAGLCPECGTHYEPAPRPTLVVALRPGRFPAALAAIAVCAAMFTLAHRVDVVVESWIEMGGLTRGQQVSLRSKIAKGHIAWHDGWIRAMGLAFGTMLLFAGLVCDGRRLAVASLIAMTLAIPLALACARWAMPDRHIGPRDDPSRTMLIVLWLAVPLATCIIHASLAWLRLLATPGLACPALAGACGSGEGRASRGGA